MVGLLGGRGASAVMAIIMLALGSSEAGAQSLPSMSVPAAIQSVGVDSGAKPLGAASLTRAVAATTAVTTASGAVIQAQPAQSVTLQLTPRSVASEAAWLRQAGWPLYALVDRFSAGAALSDEANCIATAVYFEAQGESLEGQLAVAKVIMNRAASGKYSASWCGVVKQHAQFSFVRHGAFPWVDVQSDAWRKAQGVTRLAVANAVPSLSDDVLWYHANYVAPSWGRRLSFVQRIGQHIFYRA